MLASVLSTSNESKASSTEVYSEVLCNTIEALYSLCVGLFFE